MGSGFKTFTAGAVLTASDVNNYLMEQSVMYFATAAARDLAITSPEVGMTVYVADSGSMFVYYGATTGWRPPWNQPWGVVGFSSTATASSTTTTAFIDSGLTATMTLVKDRRYLYTASMYLLSSVVEDSLNVTTNDASNNQLAGSANRVKLPGAATTFTYSYLEVPSSTGSTTRKLRFQRDTGSGNVQMYADSSFQARLIIQDIGPSTTTAPTS